MNAILCGMPKCGKSTIGRYLSKVCKISFTETDQLLRKQHQMTPRELFKQYGERSFREMEETVVGSLAGVKNQLISIGGGTLESEKNREILLNLGTVIYLKVDKEILKKRLKKHEPIFLDPIHFDESFEALWNKRTTVFEKIAQFQLDITGKTKEEVTAIILRELPINSR